MNNIDLNKIYKFQFPKGLVTWNTRKHNINKINDYTLDFNNQFELIKDDVLNWIDTIKTIGDLCISVDIHINNITKFRVSDVDNYIKLFLDLLKKQINQDDEKIKRLEMEKYYTEGDCYIEFKLFIKPFPIDYKDEYKLLIPLSKEYRKNVVDTYKNTNKIYLREYAKMKYYNNKFNENPDIVINEILEFWSAI